MCDENRRQPSECRARAGESRPASGRPIFAAIFDADANSSGLYNSRPAARSSPNQGTIHEDGDFALLRLPSCPLENLAVLVARQFVVL